MQTLSTLSFNALGGNETLDPRYIGCVFLQRVIYKGRVEVNSRKNGLMSTLRSQVTSTRGRHLNLHALP